MKTKRRIQKKKQKGIEETNKHNYKTEETTRIIQHYVTPPIWG